MSALGIVGTGNLTTVLLREEPSLAGAITTATPVWLRKNRAFFQRLPNGVDSDFANALSDGISKEVFHTTAGLLVAEADMTFIGWLLKWFVGTKTSTAPSGYKKHVFQPGLTTLKSCKVIMDIGGMSTPLNNDFVGQAIDRMAIIANILETVKVESVWVGITDQPHISVSITGATKANPCVITATGHPFKDGDIVFISGIVGMTELNGNTYTVASAAANTFALSGTDSTAYTTYVSGGTIPYNLNHITGASKANPCVITAISHGLITGDTIKISGIAGMTELNGNTYTVTKIGANSFSLDSTDSTTYTTYTSGGEFAYKGDYTDENQTVSYRDDAGNATVKFYVGAVGATTIAAMTNWIDPYYMRFDMARNRKVDNFVSDGTGKSAGITDGIFRATVNLITTLTTNQKYSSFRTGTEISFGVRLDTGLLIGGGTNYKLDIIFPRVTITNYDLNVDGIGTILPAVNLKPQKDPTAGYEVSFELFNNTTAYADAT